MDNSLIVKKAKAGRVGRDWERKHGGGDGELGMKTGEEHDDHRPLTVIFKHLCLGLDPCGQMSPGGACKSL